MTRNPKACIKSKKPRHFQMKFFKVKRRKGLKAISESTSPVVAPVAKTSSPCAYRRPRHPKLYQMIGKDNKVVSFNITSLLPEVSSGN